MVMVYWVYYWVYSGSVAVGYTVANIDITAKTV